MTETEYFDDVDDLPVDEDIPEDHVDLPHDQRGKILETHAQLEARYKRRIYKIVQWVGEFGPGAKGKQVRYIKRAMKAAGLGRGLMLTPLAGPFYVRNLNKFKKKHGLKQDGRYTRETHRKLMPYFDDYGAKQMLRIHYELSVGRKKAHMCAIAIMCVTKRNQIGYTQTSRRWSGIADRIRPPRVPPWADCSAFVEWIYWVVNVVCPSGNNFRGGYTGTQIRHGRQVKINATTPANLLFYGNQGGGVPKHVVFVIGHGKVVSHGSMGGPYLLRYNYRTDFNQERMYF